MHKILMEEEYKPTVENQGRLNPIVKDVVWTKVLKFLDVDIIYPIFDS